MKKISTQVKVAFILFVLFFIFSNTWADEVITNIRVEDMDKKGLPFVIEKLNEKIKAQQIQLEEEKLAREDAINMLNQTMAQHGEDLLSLFLQLAILDPLKNPETVNELISVTGELREVSMEAERERQKVSALLKSSAKMWKIILMKTDILYSLPNRDEDDWPDLFDLCPDDPGIYENYGCEYYRPDGDSDSDEDGYINVLDLCPDIQGYNFGCPEGYLANEDNDDLPDILDQCPHEKGFLIYNGCPYSM